MAATLLGAGSAQEAKEHAVTMLRAVNCAGIFAQARERGIEPEFSGMLEQVMRPTNEHGRLNTEFHYAFELLEILKRIQELTFVFDAPAFKGVAAAHTADLLQEATRCYLFGLPRACVAACRALLEDGLSQIVPAHEVLNEKWKSGPDAKLGTLFLLINAAIRTEGLQPDLGKKAAQRANQGKRCAS